MTIVYDYDTGRFIRNYDNTCVDLDIYEEIPRKYKQNTRWIVLPTYDAIDLAYIYTENELAKQEGIEEIEV